MSELIDYRIIVYEYNKYDSGCIKDSFMMYNKTKQSVFKTATEIFLDILKKYISASNCKYTSNYDFTFPKIDNNGISPGSIFYNTKIVALMFLYEISYNSDNPNNKKYRGYSISVFNHKRYITDKNGNVIYVDNYKKGNKDYNKLYDTIDNIIET